MRSKLDCDFGGRCNKHDSWSISSKKRHAGLNCKVCLSDSLSRFQLGEAGSQKSNRFNYDKVKCGLSTRNNIHQNQSLVWRWGWLEIKKHTKLTSELFNQDQTGTLNHCTLSLLRFIGATMNMSRVK